ncbi:MAG: PQQ-binding-like beta-propeller repeat protein, partial [Lentisphaeria bacterium]|nr:PQQ-binding-like beta-propeller repeat protein [Lentisphaeria bacterium]NQZ70365.1 PQQ-binding-like beta-propeller repeat protein [Lentisphaeria bacterium]
MKRYLLISLCFLAYHGQAADWPQWRYDASRSANSPEQLDDKLELIWTRTYSKRVQTWDDPLNNDLMQYDRIFEPIVVGDLMILSFNDRDKVVALNTQTGKEVWQFFTEGPVRLPPSADKGKLFVCSDDGYLYCLDLATGKEIWKFRGGPSALKGIGNKRLISSWPARGGPVVRDGNVYFTASIWPMMGTFIYSLDAATGKINWINDGTSST